MTLKTRPNPIEIMNGHTIFTLHEICERCGVRDEFIIELVEYGVIAPLEDSTAKQWVFDAAALARLNRALRLHRDLEINLPGLAIALDLLDEVQRLHHQVELLDAQMKQFHGG